MPTITKGRSRAPLYKLFKSRLEGASALSDADQIREGIPWRVASLCQEELAITDRDFADFLGVSSRTLSRQRKSAGQLSKAASDRLYRILRVMRMAEMVLEDPALGLHWLRRPQPGLGGKIPLELLDTEPGFEAVETLLQRIEYGVAA